MDGLVSTPAPAMESEAGPLGGTAESAAWFREALAEIGESQTGLARWMQRLGDDRKPANILRSIQRMASGDARVSGEMRVLLTLRRRKAVKARARQEAGG